MSGLLWATVVTTSESLTQPTRTLEPVEFAQLFSQVGVSYALGGILISILTVEIEARFHSWKGWFAAALTILSATALHLAVTRLAFRLMPQTGIGAMLTFVPEFSQQAAFALWVFVVYGGAYIGALFLFLRSIRRHTQSRDLERARLATDARINRAIADDRSRLIQPELLLASMAELSRRYVEDPNRAEWLLDKLVRFLRSVQSAMPKRTSSLAAALDLIANHADLCRALERPCCALELQPGIETATIPFPPLVLTSLLDAFTSFMPAGEQFRLRVGRQQRETQILIDGDGCNWGQVFPDTIERRARAALHAMGGRLSWLREPPSECSTEPPFVCLQILLPSEHSSHWQDAVGEIQR
ncbi:hypothetical protein [Novosphingobium pentaromativorans]|uniref:Signal transduction histidine kinase internal region domain-containing protein n=1 Tax=Novosphingobium pentaromativorans US6-1 TaxID=1088721 RepID=G6E9G0_9SPHN|nr:hypothetical protein [Novosphingobium pentaromativorans]EHJ62059.1 hypothetical protein NSU_0981 [Novosphingobium pentaromativorans US6-1]